MPVANISWDAWRTTYDVVLTGEILPDYQPEAVQKAVAEIFQADTPGVIDLFSGGDKIVKRRLSRLKAQRYVQAIGQAGAVVRMQITPKPTSQKAKVRRPGSKRSSRHHHTTGSAAAPPMPVGSDPLASTPQAPDAIGASPAYGPPPTTEGEFCWKTAGITLAIGLILGLALGYWQFGHWRDNLVTLNAAEKAQIEQLQAEVTETLLDLSSATGRLRALEPGLTKSLVDARLETLRNTKALIEQRIAAIRTGSRIRSDAPGAQGDPKGAEQLARDMAEQKREIANLRMGVNSPGGMGGALNPATLAAQEQSLVMMRLAYVSAKYGLPGFKVRHDGRLQASPPAAAAAVSTAPAEPAPPPPVDVRIPAGAGPFGLTMGRSARELMGIEIPSAPGRYILDTVPTPHQAFVKYVAEAAPRAGLCWIKGMGRAIQTDRLGTQLREEYTRIRDELVKAYGKDFKETDHLAPESLWKEPGDWMMGLVQKDRALMSTWHAAEASPLPHALSSVAISVSASSSGEGYVYLEYQFANGPQCEAEFSAKPDAGPPGNAE